MIFIIEKYTLYADTIVATKTNSTIAYEIRMFYSDICQHKLKRMILYSGDMSIYFLYVTLWCGIPVLINHKRRFKLFWVTLHTTSVLSFHIDVVLRLSIRINTSEWIMLEFSIKYIIFILDSTETVVGSSSSGIMVSLDKIYWTHIWQYPGMAVQDLIKISDPHVPIKTDSSLLLWNKSLKQIHIIYKKYQPLLLFQFKAKIQNIPHP